LLSTARSLPSATVLSVVSRELAIAGSRFSLVSASVSVLIRCRSSISGPLNVFEKSCS